MAGLNETKPRKEGYEFPGITNGWVMVPTFLSSKENEMPLILFLNKVYTNVL